MMGVLHLIPVPDHFHFRVFQNDLVGEGLVNRDIDVLVDGCREHKPAVALVIGRQICPAAFPSEILNGLRVMIKD